MKGSAALKKDVGSGDSWRGFQPGDWTSTINVRDFIVRNVTPYSSDEKFLAPASQRTKAVWAKLQPYFADERKKGVLAVDAKNPSTLLAHEAGYIDRDNEIIVGLQTDQPFKRAIFPFGGLRMVEAGLKAAGFEPDDKVHEAFTKYRKSHNDGVFDAYTPEIMNCRRSGIITGCGCTFDRKCASSGNGRFRCQTKVRSSLASKSSTRSATITETASRFSQRKATSALVTMPASGWLTSCAIDAASSPMVVSPATRSSSACACLSSSSACRRSLMSMTVPTNTSSPLLSRSG